VCPYVGL